MKLLAASALISAAVLARADDGKVSLLLFGDLYSVSKHNTPAAEGKSGLWARRINVTLDKKLTDRWSYRARVEGKDSGDPAGGQSLDFFMKDLWVRYTAGGHKVTLGLIPTPTWEPAEERLGYRPIEKTPMDLLKMGGARDKGISVAGPLGKDGKLNYALMWGDGSGTKFRRADTSTIYGRLGYQATENLALDLYADNWNKTGDVNWKSVKGEAFWKQGAVKAGLSYATQRRTKPGAADVNLNVVSLFGEMAANEKWSPFVRYDVVNGQVPDADKIEYLKMSKDGKPSLFLFGVRYRVNENWELVPNVEIVSYRAGAGGITPRTDTFFRLTFQAKF